MYKYFQFLNSNSFTIYILSAKITDSDAKVLSSQLSVTQMLQMSVEMLTEFFSNKKTFMTFKSWRLIFSNKVIQCRLVNMKVVGVQTIRHGA